MKNKTKFIVCIVLVVITICISTISAFGIATYPSYSDTDYEYSSDIYYKPILPFEKMTITNHVDEGVQDDRKYVIDMQNSLINAYETINQNVNNINQVTETTNTIHSITHTETIRGKGVYSVRDFSKLFDSSTRRKGIEFESQTYYDIGLNNVYGGEAPWSNIISYAIPNPGIKVLRNENQLYSSHQPYDYIKEIFVEFSEVRNKDNTLYIDYKIDITTQNNGKHTMIDTSNDTIDRDITYMVFEYDDNWTFKNFIEVVYPMPISFDNSYENIRARKDNIVFKLLQEISRGTDSVTKSWTEGVYDEFYWTSTARQEDFVSGQWVEHTDMKLTTNVPNLFFNNMFSIEYEFAPFVITNRQNLDDLIWHSPYVYSTQNYSVSTIMSADITVLVDWGSEVKINENGEIKEYYEQRGIYQLEIPVIANYGNGRLFFNNELIDMIEGYITLHVNDDLYTTHYQYSNDPLPILFNNFKVTQIIDTTDVIAENDLANLVKYNITYEDTRNEPKFTNSNIATYITDNENFNTDASGKYGFTVGRGDMNVPPPEGWNFAQFFDGTLSFLNTPIFGPISIGTIMLTVLGIGVLFGLLKYFAGG